MVRKALVNVVAPTWAPYIEFLNPAANKGVALMELCSTLGLDLEEVVAFGDDLNDLEMLAFVGEGVAVANAKEEAKQAARRVSEWTNNEDAIARELAMLFPHTASQGH